MSVLIDQPSSGDLSLRIGQTFAPEDAWRIHQIVQQVAQGTRVEIDFRLVRDCNDFALSLLAQDIVTGRAPIVLHGTTQHQQRVLGYFGVKLGSPAPDFGERAADYA